MPDTIIGCRALRVAAPLLIHTQGVLRQVSQKITGKGGKAQLRFLAIIISDKHNLVTKATMCVSEAFPAKLIVLDKTSTRGCWRPPVAKPTHS